MFYGLGDYISAKPTNNAPALNEGQGPRIQNSGHTYTADDLRPRYSTWLSLEALDIIKQNGWQAGLVQAKQERGLLGNFWSLYYRIRFKCGWNPEIEVPLQTEFNSLNKNQPNLIVEFIQKIDRLQAIPLSEANKRLCVDLRTQAFTKLMEVPNYRLFENVLPSLNCEELLVMLDDSETRTQKLRNLRIFNAIKCRSGVSEIDLEFRGYEGSLQSLKESQRRILSSKLHAAIDLLRGLLAKQSAASSLKGTRFLQDEIIRLENILLRISQSNDLAHSSRPLKPAEDGIVSASSKTFNLPTREICQATRTNVAEHIQFAKKSAQATAQIVTEVVGRSVQAAKVSVQENAHSAQQVAQQGIQAAKKSAQATAHTVTDVVGQCVQAATVSVSEKAASAQQEEPQYVQDEVQDGIQTLKTDSPAEVPKTEKAKRKTRVIEFPSERAEEIQQRKNQRAAIAGKYLPGFDDSLNVLKESNPELFIQSKEQIAGPSSQVVEQSLDDASLPQIAQSERLASLKETAGQMLNKVAQGANELYKEATKTHEQKLKEMAESNPEAYIALMNAAADRALDAPVESEVPGPSRADVAREKAAEKARKAKDALSSWWNREKVTRI